MSEDQIDQHRRRFIKLVSSLAAAGVLIPQQLLAASAKTTILKKIPKSGERLPVIGIGSSRTFDIDPGSSDIKNVSTILKAFFGNGGSLIDSSPMYGNAEQVIGNALAQLGETPKLFAATKVWTDGKRSGIRQMQQSMQRMRVKKFDLMQIHNLRDWKIHLATLKDWKQAGKIRYIGVTTSHGRFHEELATLLKKEAFDFVQLSYNIDNREVEKELLPIAHDKAIAVLVNRPYQRGSLFSRSKGKPLPSWAKDFDCQTWGQFYLKFIVSHPAVTCVIPATSKLKHLLDNMAAGFGRLPDQKTRLKMLSAFSKL